MINPPSTSDNVVAVEVTTQQLSCCRPHKEAKEANGPPRRLLMGVRGRPARGLALDSPSASDHFPTALLQPTMSWLPDSMLQLMLQLLVCRQRKIKYNNNETPLLLQRRFPHLWLLHFRFFVAFLQLNLPWIAEWAYAGMFDVAARFQNHDQFWISHQKNQGSFFFIFPESEKMSSYSQKRCFCWF